MKKIISLVLCIILVLLLCSCGQSYSSYMSNVRKEEDEYWADIEDTDPENLRYSYIDSLSFKNITDEPTDDTIGIWVQGVKTTIMDESIVKIPAKIDGYDVVAVGGLYVYTVDNETTTERQKIEKLYIPDTVVSLYLENADKIQRLRVPNNPDLDFGLGMFLMVNEDLNTLILSDVDENSDSSTLHLSNLNADTEKLYIGDGVAKIYSSTTTGDKLELVSIPPSVEFIGTWKDVSENLIPKYEWVEDNIFPEDVTVVCEKGSYAEEYAEKYDLNIEYV